MKTFKCQNCKRETQKDDDVLMVMCPCGYAMDEKEVIL